jgi:hypothetical protein
MGADTGVHADGLDGAEFMWTISRSVTMAVAAVAFGLGAGSPASAASAARAATPGWRQVKQFAQCGNGQVLSVTAKGPLNAWASGYVPVCNSLPAATAPLLTHWNGRSWREVTLPSRFTTNTTDGATAVAPLSGSETWAFAGLRQASYALLWQHNRWHTYALANNSYLSTAVAFSQTNAWAFGSVGASAYAARFNGKVWRQVPIPVVPQSTADLAPTNMWAVGPLAAAVNTPFPQPYGLAHWTGRWKTTPFPDLRLPHGAGIDYAWVVSDNSLGTFVAASISSQPGWVLLHWTGSRWFKLTTPAPADYIGPMARDGNGGLWIASVPATLTCSGTSCNDITMLHRSAAGAWASIVVNVQNLGVTTMRLIPGTLSVWAGGNITQGADNGFFPVMLKYGP